MDRIAEHEARVREFFSALTARDRSGMAELLAEDVRWVIPRSSPPPYGGTHSGRERVLDMMLGASEQIFVPGTHTVEIVALIANETSAAAEVRMQAKTPRGQDYDNRYVFFFEFEDGIVREFREHLDTRYAAPFLDL